jgi:beta-lactamase superfamily II metal-dependent hydrolase
MSGWEKTFYTYIWIFNIGRGLAIYMRLPQNIGFIYDMGCSEQFSPRKFVEKNILPKLKKYNEYDFAQLMLSHPHVDHISEISGENDSKFIKTNFVTCPHDKESPAGYDDEKIDFTKINNPDNKNWIIKKYQEMIKGRNLPLQTISAKDVSIPNVEYGIYYVRPPVCERLYKKDNQKYSNSISLVFYYRHGNQNILIPGDITPDAFEKILECDEDVERRFTNFNSNNDTEDSKKNTRSQAKLKDILNKQGLTILIPSHHGLKSGYCSKLYNYIQGGKPRLNVISEKRHVGENDGSIHSDYQNSQGVKGVEVDIEGKKETRYSVSTRQGHVLLVFKGTDNKPHVYLRNNPEDLLSIVP